MTLQWFVTGASLLVALIALNQARRTAKRLEQLSQNDGGDADGLM